MIDEAYIDRKDLPKQKNEHSALDDAKWNKKVYDFLKTKEV